MFASIFIYQFLACGILAAIIGSYVLLRAPRAWTSLAFVAFAIDVSLWELFVFLHRTASTLDATTLYFHVVKVTFPLLTPLYLLTILTIWRVQRRNLLALVPGVIYLFLQFQIELEFLSTEFGWSYTAAPSIPQYVIGVIIVGYTIFTATRLYLLVKAAPTRRGRMKFRILFWSFICFQTIGVTVSNIVLAFTPQAPPIGGFAYLFTFSAIAYNLLVPDEPITPTPSKNQFIEE
jgi:hypothetical protein